MANNQNPIGFIKSHVGRAILNPVPDYPRNSCEFSILVKTGQMITQPKRRTHHVMYCVIYFEAYDNVINDIKERFHQPDFEIYKHVQNILVHAVNQKSYDDSLSIYS